MSGVHLCRPRSLALCVLMMLVLSLSGAGAAAAALLEVRDWSGSNQTWMERDTPRFEFAEPKSSGAGWRRVDSPAGITVLVESVGLSGDVATDTDNDFTRIQEGIAAAVVLGAGTTVRLAGTFDWTETLANDDWVAADYGILMPGNVADITITAATLGSAVIQGPGELPDVYYEAFLYGWGATYQGWTISNLDVRGFEWTFGFFYTGAGGSVDDFDGLSIVDNRIEIPTDANALAAGNPDESFQNVGIHLGFGDDQTIAGNEIVLAGTGVSDTGNGAGAASVVLQSNSSGGSYEDGLMIADNLIRITGAQSADPEYIYGIWENFSADTANMTVSGNRFLNENAGNDPAVNRQLGFRITSHSSATTTVSYTGNTVVGAHTGIGWLKYSSPYNPPATAEPVVVSGNELLDCATGIWVRSDNGNGKGSLVHNRYWQTPVGVEVENATATSIDWWGCNGGPNATGCADATLTSGGTLDATSWLEIGIEGLPGSAEVGAPVAVEAVLRETLSNGVALSLPPSPVVFAATPAAITSPHDTDAGIAEATYTPAAAGIAQISATLDATTVQAQLLVTQGGIVTVSSIGQTSSTPNAADNDFTRINDMLQAVDDDVTVRLLGTFDWTEPFANASWQLGSDGLPGTGDEYGILPPSGFQNVTLDAATLGGAIIQGPGDLPGVNLEAFLAMWGGSYKDWTFARLDIRGFDLGIGMFADGGADLVNQFDGVELLDNRIELPVDWNAAVAPVDVNQNIAIHLGFGDHQTIEGNEIVIPGTGVSDTSDPVPANWKYATSVALQSNTSGGTLWDGLSIADNLIRVTGVQSADPERIYGIWENSHGHGSNITVSGNQFVNEAAGNDPAVNRQLAFRVTAHSTATSTVAYSNNTVVGAHDGIAWLTYPGGFLPPATVEPVLVTGNTLVGCARGVHVRSENGNAKGTLRHNRYWQTPIGVEAENATATSVDWWGCNGGPAAVGCSASAITAGGALDAASWLTLGLEALPGSAEVGELVPVTATLRETLGGGVALSFPPTSILFGATPAAVTSPHDTANGAALAAYTPVAAGLATLSATLDSTTVQAQLLVTQGGIVTVGSVAETASTPTPTDNDYTRINNMLQAVDDDVTVRLVGTFDWTESNAAASWALGSDGVAATGDDWGILAPVGFQNVTLDAATLGAAVIQGPGDLPAVNLEGFLGMWGGTYKDWTIARLDIRGFDLGIGMFADGGADPGNQFDGVQVIDNRIELATDLNTTAAPADVNQNIALHLAVGDHQTIQGNEIVIPGTGVSDTSDPVPANWKYASSVALQSNTSGGAGWDGLLIADNIVRVTGAQSADPEKVLGIWENGHAHLSGITVSGNRFVNDHPGNDRALNRQTAFRVTSHSSATTTVLYEGNEATGASIGIELPYAMGAVEPVVLRSNNLVGNGSAVLVSGAGEKVDLGFNRLVDNLSGVNAQAGTVNAENNWWGCNAGPGTAGCDAVTIGGGATVDADPWLTLTLVIDDPSVVANASTGVTAALVLNSDLVDTSLGGFYVPDGIPAAFGATGGSVAPTPVDTFEGEAASTFTAGALGGTFQVAATVDGETVSTGVEVVGDLLVDGFETGDFSRWSDAVGEV